MPGYDSIFEVIMYLTNLILKITAHKAEVQFLMSPDDPLCIESPT